MFGIGFGALIRSQLGATVSATVLYLVLFVPALSAFFGLTGPAEPVFALVLPALVCGAPR